MERCQMADVSHQPACRSERGSYRWVESEHSPEYKERVLTWFGIISAESWKS